VTNAALAALLGKQAAELTKATVRSSTVPVSGEDGPRRVAEALSAGLRPSSEVAPTRYGRKPYQRAARS